MTSSQRQAQESYPSFTFCTPLTATLIDKAGPSKEGTKAELPQSPWFETESSCPFFAINFGSFARFSQSILGNLSVLQNLRLGQRRYLTPENQIIALKNTRICGCEGVPRLFSRHPFAVQSHLLRRMRLAAAQVSARAQLSTSASPG